MQIIFYEDVATALRERHIVLELETFNVEGKQVPAYCVVAPEKLGFALDNIDVDIAAHEQLVQAIKDQDAKACVTLCHDLKGKFGGELDSFYEIIGERFSSAQ